MLAVDFYEIGEIDDSLLWYAVCVSRYGDKWIYGKHRERTTWELPGGRREPGEPILETAKRELYEETGALDFDLSPVCVYSVTNTETHLKTYGFLCYALVTELGELPESEIEYIRLFESQPESLTYPEIQPKLLEKVLTVTLP